MPATHKYLRIGKSCYIARLIAAAISGFQRVMAAGRAKLPSMSGFIFFHSSPRMAGA